MSDVILSYATRVSVTYTNWRGETSHRDIIPQEIWFGHTEYHKEPQWLLKAIDVEDHDKVKDFAMSGFMRWEPA